MQELVETTVISSLIIPIVFFFSSRRRHTRLTCDWSSDVCSSDLSSRGLNDTFDLYIGGRALRENLQLEREMWPADEDETEEKIGRASCRERVLSWEVGGW